MRGLPAHLALLALLAGCAGGSEPAVESAPEMWPADSAGVATPGGPSIDWRTAWRDDAVNLAIIDNRSHYRVEQVRLTGPDGRSYDASDITRNVLRDRGDDWYGRPSMGLGGVFGSHGGGLGVGLSFPLGNRAGSDVEYSRTTTEARIPVADPERYRRTAQAWTLDVTLLEPSGERRYARIPAPVP